MLALGAAACATTTTQAVLPAATPAPPTFEQKMSWMLRLEDQRVLRDPASAVPVPAPPVVGKGVLLVPQPPPPPPPPPPDLIRLLSDSEGRVRRRAALAI